MRCKIDQSCNFRQEKPCDHATVICVVNVSSVSVGHSVQDAQKFGWELNDASGVLYSHLCCIIMPIIPSHVSFVY